MRSSIIAGRQDRRNSFFKKIFKRGIDRRDSVGVMYSQRKRRSFSFWYKEIGALPFFVARKRNLTKE